MSGPGWLFPEEEGWVVYDQAVHGPLDEEILERVSQRACLLAWSAQGLGGWFGVLLFLGGRKRGWMGVGLLCGWCHVGVFFWGGGGCVRVFRHTRIYTYTTNQLITTKTPTHHVKTQVKDLDPIWVRIIDPKTGVPVLSDA